MSRCRMPLIRPGYRELDQALLSLPEDLRQYVRVDIEGLERDWETSLHVVHDPNRTWVFNR